MGSTVWGSAVAKITALSGQATLARGSNSLTAALGAALETKDTIITAKDSKAQLTFSDNTIVTVGKQSKFSVDDYLDDNTPNSNAKFNMISGTIRAMSGKIGKIAPEKFTVKTKTATIGIRGTDFIVNVLPTGELATLCMQGSILVTPSDAAGTIIIPAGSFITISKGNEASDVKEFTPAELNKVLDDGLSLPALVEVQEPTAVTQTLTETAETTTSPEMMTILATNLPVVDSTVLAADTGTTLVTNTVLATPVGLPQHFVGYTAGGYVNLSSSLVAGPLRGSVDIVSDPRARSVVGSVRLYDGAGSPFLRADIDALSPDYVGVDDFQVAVDSFAFEGAYSSYVASPITSGTAYMATSGDTANDYFAFGDWGINPMTVDNGTTITTNAAHGYWAAGVETPIAVIDAFRTANATITYNGGLIGQVVTKDTGNSILVGALATITSSSLQFIVNFTNDTFAQTSSFITDAGKSYVINAAGTVSPNGFASTDVTSFTENGSSILYTAGALSGSFYGPDGKIMGGVFTVGGTLSTNTIGVQGAFKATAP